MKCFLPCNSIFSGNTISLSSLSVLRCKWRKIMCSLSLSDSKQAGQILWLKSIFLMFGFNAESTEIKTQSIHDIKVTEAFVTFPKNRNRHPIQFK